MKIIKIYTNIANQVILEGGHIKMSLYDSYVPTLVGYQILLDLASIGDIPYGLWHGTQPAFVKRVMACEYS